MWFEWEYMFVNPKIQTEATTVLTSRCFWFTRFLVWFENFKNYLNFNMEKTLTTNYKGFRHIESFLYTVSF